MSTEPDFPDRSHRTPEELSDVEGGAAQSGLTRTREKPPPGIAFRLLGGPRTLSIYAVVFGAIGLAYAFDTTINSGHSLLSPVFGIPLFVYGSLVVSGVMTLRKTSRWRVASVFAWVLQVPSFRIGHLSYSIFTMPALEWKVWPEFGLAFSTSGLLSVWWLSVTHPLYLGVNLVAASAAGYCVKQCRAAKANNTLANDGMGRSRLAG